jgi:hypothetical protein
MLTDLRIQYLRSRGAIQVLLRRFLTGGPYRPLKRIHRSLKLLEFNHSVSLRLPVIRSQGDPACPVLQP